MKCYVTKRHWRITGKGWEIREYLRQQLKTAGRDVTLLGFLQNRPGYAGMMEAEAAAVGR